MTTTARSPRLLVLSTVILALIGGVALLGMPHGQQQPVPATASAGPAATDPSTAAVPPASQPTGPRPPSPPSTTSAASTPSAPEPALAPHGEGPAGDRAIQRSLEESWPADLPAGDQRELLTAGRALLRADATGVGRGKWPNLFPASDQAVAPAFATARFRIQAAIARRDGSPDKAVVHLVWAGMDRGGTFTDLRISDWHFTRGTSKKGAATWTPQPRI
ncbi:hypothetical protein C3489_27705 [Streptomyces sp. Ru71]|uniref:hypothetical protein n=1 Tax=Streptomyces sp. Ru71 TaxID=2080746 RepID=UPI000CDD6C68|nr:hypothetical protein [Streptomyces sp. Ru71]POX48154.1 hypothetical protein C3489_27705 [Streptomyces sp. Ru71]